MCRIVLWFGIPGGQQFFACSVIVHSAEQMFFSCAPSQSNVKSRPKELRSSSLSVITLSVL